MAAVASDGTCVYRQIHIDVARNATDDFNPFHDGDKWMRIRGRLCASSCAEVSRPCSVGRYGSGGLGLPEQDFLVLFEQIHVQVAVVLQPAFVDFDGQSPHQT